MRFLFLLLFPITCFATDIPPTPFPVFLKLGFSTILEFDEAPSRVVLGDGQSFQIERLNKSIVLKTLAPYATTNMFVYFSSKATRLFVLTASEDAEPTYYKKFEEIVFLKEKSSPVQPMKIGVTVISAKFDDKKDYFTVEFQISSDATMPIKPSWDLVRLAYNQKFIAPKQLWSERKEVQKDSKVKSRLVFVKPNIPANLVGVRLIVPIVGRQTPFSILMNGRVK